MTATTHYDSARREYHIDLRQESAATQPSFHLPLEVALVDGEGRFVPGTEQVFEFTQETSRMTFPNISQEPAFASLNRDYSFYGAFQQENASPETLASQVRLDTNAFNRVEAMRRLTDRQRINLIMDPGYVIDPQWIRLYGEILYDRNLPAALKAYFLRIEEQPLDREYCTWYRELVVAREKLMLAVNRAYLNDSERCLSPSGYVPPKTISQGWDRGPHSQACASRPDCDR